MENPFEHLHKRLSSIEAALIQIQHLLGISKSNLLKDELAEKGIRVLKLSTKVFNVLLDNDIYIIGELCKVSKKDLIKMRGMGKSALVEIENALAEIGMKLFEN